MVLEVLNIDSFSKLNQQFPKLLKCNFSTIKNVSVEHLIKDTKKQEKKLKLSQYTKNLLQNNEKILHFDKASSTSSFHNITKIENVDITTVTKPLKYPIVLCHGLFGFDKKGPENIPFLQVHYWNKIQKYLEQLGCKVVVPKVSPAGGVKYRAHELMNFIEANFPKQQVHLIAHSMGGLDCRYLITHLKQQRSFKVLTLTTLSTPHRGSPFMDWCRKKFGVGWIRDPKHIPSVQPSFMAKSIKNASIIFNRREQQQQQQQQQKRQLPRPSFSKLFFKTFSKGKEGEAEAAAAAAEAKQGGYDEHALQEIKENNSLALSLLFNYSSSPIINNYNMRLLEEIYDMQTSSYYHMLCKLMSAFDMPAYRILTTDFCNNIFNPLTPDDPEVMYQSYGASRRIPLLNPLCISQQIIKRTGQVENDGLVGVESAKWGHYKGTVHADHFDLNDRWTLHLCMDRFNVQDFYYSVIRELYPFEEI
ncbi:alpha/beta-hydrolase [Piromyces finnis]|uniref:GPI inositol-deacylase n=1 Tax=Piromyces finnis TaxID=1754191 RepID=A0A1Y1V4Q2_9FUNG|nr:alpha/beta-hydrolase [Piromyces finnis]|eukprot:ORX46434.1 alpha/beta-hydrolase [Piromyces finnis]